MAINISKFIDERIDHYIKNSDYVDLSFQRELIKESVRFFLWTHATRSATERCHFGCFGQFSTERLSGMASFKTYGQQTKPIIKPADFVAEYILGEDFKDFLIDNPNYNIYKDNHKHTNTDIIDNVFLDTNYYPMPVANLDIGLGKTIVGVLTAVIIIEALLEVNKNVEELVKKNTVIPYTYQSNRFLNMTTKDFQINYLTSPENKKYIESVVKKLNLNDTINLHFIDDLKNDIIFKEFDPNANFSNLYFELFDKIGLAYIQWAYDKIVSMKDEEEGLKFIENTILQGYSCDEEEVRELEEIYKNGVNGKKANFEHLKEFFWKHQQDMTAEYSTKYKLPLCIIDDIDNPNNLIYMTNDTFKRMFLDGCVERKFLGFTGIGLANTYNSHFKPLRGHFSKLTEYYSLFFARDKVFQELKDKKLISPKDTTFEYLTLKTEEAKEYERNTNMLLLKQNNKQEKIQKDIEDIKSYLFVLEKSLKNYKDNEDINEDDNLFDCEQNLLNLNGNLKQINKLTKELHFVDQNLLRKEEDEENQLIKAIDSFKKDKLYQINIKDILTLFDANEWKNGRILYCLNEGFKESSLFFEKLISQLKIKNPKMNVVVVNDIFLKNEENIKKLSTEKDVIIVGIENNLLSNNIIQNIDKAIFIYVDQLSPKNLKLILKKIEAIGNHNDKTVYYVNIAKDFKKTINEDKKQESKDKIKKLLEKFKNIESKYTLCNNDIERYLSYGEKWKTKELDQLHQTNVNLYLKILAQLKKALEEMMK